MWFDVTSSPDVTGEVGALLSVEVNWVVISSGATGMVGPLTAVGKNEE